MAAGHRHLHGWAGRASGALRRRGRGLRRRGLALAALLGAALVAGAAGAGTIPCGTFYKVGAGDTLYAISMATYDKGLARVLFAANSDVLNDITKLPPGTEIWLPCLDGSTPRTRIEAVTAGFDKAAAAGTGAAAGASAGGSAGGSTAVAPPVPVGPITLVTGSEFAPFAHKDLPEGGMTPELLRLALAAALPEREVTLEFVDDWTSHDELLRRGKVDLAFPWYRPDCMRPERLDETMQRRCGDFDFSDPLFEVETGYYTAAGSAMAGVDDYAALKGKRLCRPAGYFTFDLMQEGLAPPDTDLRVPPGPGDCFVLLERGEVDVVTMNREVAAMMVTRLGLTGKVAEIRALASSQTMHVVAAKSNIGGEALLAAINEGLAELRESGRWFEVVSQHLGSFGLSLR